jgi:mono/diheme cytochrome c family protein
MFRSLLNLSTIISPTAILTSAILFAVLPNADPGRAPQDQTATPPTAQAAPAAPGPKNPVKPTAESQAKAKKMYGFDCALCHGDNGNGKTDLAKDMQLTMSDLSDPKTLAGMPDSEIFDVIRKGKDKMPPEEAARAKDDDVWNIIIYIRGLSKNGVATASTPSQ